MIVVLRLVFYTMPLVCLLGSLTNCCILLLGLDHRILIRGHTVLLNKVLRGCHCRLTNAVPSSPDMSLGFLANCRRLLYCLLVLSQ